MIPETGGVKAVNISLSHANYALICSMCQTAVLTKAKVTVFVDEDSINSSEGTANIVYLRLSEGGA